MDDWLGCGAKDKDDVIKSKKEQCIDIIATCLEMLDTTTLAQDYDKERAKKLREDALRREATL